MAREPGDKNYSAREKRLIAELAAEKAKVEAARAEIKVKDARLKELRENRLKVKR
jgi:hypothetical protein